MTRSTEYDAAAAPPEVLALAARVMPLLLEGQHPALTVLRAQYSVAKVSKVELTGVGFFVSFDIPTDAPRCDPPSMAGGNVRIMLAGVVHGAGCVVFVRNGRLTMLEGYTNAGEDWPEHPVVLTLSEAVPLQPPGR